VARRPQGTAGEEKEVTRARDRRGADRRWLPMVRVDEPYTFVSLLRLPDEYDD
jgi:predicted dithiol-disulfide oxidoreductase (DUF899 family)